MAWEQRGSHSYYYRKERCGGRIRSIYVGRGDLAGIVQVLDRMQSQELKAQRIERQREIDGLKSLDASIHSLTQLGSTFTQAVLIAAGFHQHKGQWRKRLHEDKGL